MKIAIITSGILPVPAVQGGAVENLIDYLLEYNNKHQLHDITIFSISHRKIKKHAALRSQVNHYKYIDVHSLWFKIGARFYARKPKSNYYYYQLEFFLEQIIKKIKSSSYDLILLENRPGFAIRLSEVFPTISIISHIHTNLLHIPSEENIKVMKSTKAFIAVSNYIKKEIQKIDTNKDIRVVYNGLDSHLFDPKTIIPIQREKLGFSQEDFIAVFWGRLVPDKGIKELLLAYQLLKRHNNIKLLVIGSINYEDTNKESNDFMNELHNLANEIPDKVTFTGYIPYENIPRYISIADVAIIPSHINEAFGMTCIEACALGLPVIATNDGGIPETLVEQKHILLDLTKELPYQIADAILSIKNNYSIYKGNVLNQIFHKDFFSKTFYETITALR